MLHGGRRQLPRDAPLEAQCLRQFVCEAAVRLYARATREPAGDGFLWYGRLSFRARH